MNSIPSGTLRLRVTEIEAVTPEIKRLTLKSADGSWLPPFSGGSHITLLIDSPTGTIRNAYSLMSSPYDGSQYQVAVRKVPHGKGGSVAIHDTVGTGQILSASHPANLFGLSKHAKHHILIAGGVGITPIFSQAEELGLKGANFEAHIAVRGKEHARLALELQERFGDNIFVYDGVSNNRMDISHILAHRKLGTHAYVCGPQSMIESVVETASQYGWPQSSVHFERFEDAGSVGNPFTVTFALSGVTIGVPPEQSLLEAAESNGLKLPYLCRGGACGECETEVLHADGEIDHRDDWLSESDRRNNNAIMPCVSRANCSQLIINA